MTTEQTTAAPAAAPAPSAAEVLYGSPPPPPQDATAQPERKWPTGAQRALADGGPVPTLDAPSPEIAALRKEAGRDSATDAGAFKTQTETIRTMLETADLNASPQEIAKQTLEFKAMALDLGASGDDIAMLASLANASAANPRTAEAMAAEQADTVRGLREEFGNQWQTKLAAAKALAQRDPRLNEFLNQNGIGNHPQVVRRLIDLADIKRRNDIVASATKGTKQ